MNRTLLGLAALLCLASCSKKEKDKEPPRTVSEESLKGKARTKFDSPEPTAAQLDRRGKYTAMVKALGLPTLAKLPVVEDELKVKPRTAAEIADRTFATALCAIKGEDNDQALVDSLIEEYQAQKLFSPAERLFIETNATQQDLMNFAWRYECVHVFLWALGYLPELNPPDKLADVPKEISLLREKGVAGLAREAKPRSTSELLDQADYYYRLHWGAIELRIKKSPPNPRANEEIIQERHRALNWLTRYLNQSWDDVTTDT
jgi:hypothetical protein